MYWEQAFAFKLYSLPNNITYPMTEAFQWVQELPQTKEEDL